MTRTHYSLLLPALVLSLLATDVAQAGRLGIFGRRWERRKAELHQEVSSTVSAELTAKLDRDMDAAEKQLSATIRQRLDRESAALEKLIAQRMVELRKHADAIVAAESKRLEQEVQQQVAQLRKEAQAEVAAHAKRLASEVEQAKQELAQQATAQLAKLPDLVQRRVDQRFDAWIKTQAADADNEKEDGSDDKPGTPVPPANNDAARTTIKQSEGNPGDES